MMFGPFVKDFHSEVIRNRFQKLSSVFVGIGTGNHVHQPVTLLVTQLSTIEFGDALKNQLSSDPSIECS
jgi:hypothetical protein